MKLLAEWFWTDRWDGSSAALLPMEAQGIYRAMLSQAWRRGAHLPKDPEMIQRAIRCTPEEWARSWPKVKRYWRVDGEDLVNDTQLDIYREALAGAERASERARKAGLASASSRTQAQHKPDSSSTQVEPRVNPPSPVSVSVTDHQEQPAPSRRAASPDGARRRVGLPVGGSEGELLRRFDEHHQRVLGSPYLAQFSRDRKILRDIVGRVGLPRAGEMLDAFWHEIEKGGGEKWNPAHKAKPDVPGFLNAIPHLNRSWTWDTPLKAPNAAKG